MTPPTTEPPFLAGAVILAAGRSIRMGQPKLLLPWGGTTVLGHLLARWRQLGAGQIGVVVGADDRVVGSELDRLGFPGQNRIINAAPERGMFSSIQCAGLWPGWSPHLTHWAIVLGDQPHLRPTTLRRLLAFAAGRLGQVCQPARDGRPRHPVLMPRRLFAELPGSKAANLKEFLAGRETAVFESDDPGLDLDIDRPEDYRKALELDAQRAASQ